MPSDVQTPLPGHHVLFLLPQPHCISPCLEISQHLLWSPVYLSKCPALTAHTLWVTFHYSLAIKAIKLSLIITLSRAASTLCTSDWTITIVTAEDNPHELFNSFFICAGKEWLFWPKAALSSSHQFLDSQRTRPLPPDLSPNPQSHLPVQKPAISPKWGQLGFSSCSAILAGRGEMISQVIVTPPHSEIKSSHSPKRFESLMVSISWGQKALRKQTKLPQHTRTWSKLMGLIFVREAIQWWTALSDWHHAPVLWVSIPSEKLSPT